MHQRMSYECNIYILLYLYICLSVLMLTSLTYNEIWNTMIKLFYFILPVHTFSMILLIFFDLMIFFNQCVTLRKTKNS